MTWQDGLKGNALDWLLEAGDPGVRYLALRDLLDRPQDDAELRDARLAAGTGARTAAHQAARTAAHRQGPIGEILAQMKGAGYWVKPGPGYSQRYRSTVWALITLAQLGAAVAEDERIARGCAYLLDHALAEGGLFSYSGEPSGTIHCLQGNLLWALFELGYEDARLQEAIDWTAHSVTGEGVAPQSDAAAARRYHRGTCGPGFACGYNGGRPCAWGCVKVLLALAALRPDQQTPTVDAAARMGVDFLLGVDPATAAYPTRRGQKPGKDWWLFGFPVFYVTDLLQLVEALAALGHGRDPRLAPALDLIRHKQDGDGRWALEHVHAGKTLCDFGEPGQPNKWVTLRAMRALKAAAAE